MNRFDGSLKYSWSDCAIDNVVSDEMWPIKIGTIFTNLLIILVNLIYDYALKMCWINGKWSSMLCSEESTFFDMNSNPHFEESDWTTRIRFFLYYYYCFCRFQLSPVNSSRDRMETKWLLKLNACDEDQEQKPFCFKLKKNSFIYIFSGRIDL